MPLGVNLGALFVVGHSVWWPFLFQQAYSAIALELGGGLMLVAGLYTRRVVALALFFYTFSLALIFHPYQTVSDPTAARTDASFFFGHLSMMGGMLFVAFGAGAFSVDALITQPSTGSVAARRLRPFWFSAESRVFFFLFT